MSHPIIVSVRRPVAALVLNTVVFSALALSVIVIHSLILASMAQQGLRGAYPWFVSLSLCVGLILVTLSALEAYREWRSAQLEAARIRHRLPGPCSVLWTETPMPPEEMQWEFAAPIRPRHPQLLEDLNIEGVALIDFEVSAQGRAKNLRCLHSWPTDAVYEAARQALVRARFEPKPDIHVHHGVSYRMAFVLRLHGVTRRAPPVQPAAEPYVFRDNYETDALTH